MRQSACFFFDFWLAILSELYLGTHLPWSNINENKIKSEHGSHIRLHTTYNSIMFTYNICKPDDKCRVNTDLPTLKSGEHKINNIERVTTPDMWINKIAHNIHDLMQNARMIRWVEIINATGMKWLDGFSCELGKKQNHSELGHRHYIFFFLYIFLAG
jgi:hypothetical protein